MKTLRDTLLGALTAIVLVQTCWMHVMNSRVALLEAKHFELTVEAQFLARKVQESHEGWISAHQRRKLQLDLAVAGFRTGHYQAYDRIVRQARLKSGSPLSGGM